MDLVDTPDNLRDNQIVEDLMFGVVVTLYDTGNKRGEE